MPSSTGGSAPEWIYDKNTNTIYNPKTGERYHTEIINVTDDDPQVHVSGEMRPPKRNRPARSGRVRKSWHGTGDTSRGDLGETERKTYIGNPAELSPSFILSSEVLAREAIVNEIAIHELWQAALLALYASLDNPGEAEASPSFISAVASLVATNSAGQSEQQVRDAAQILSKGVSGHIPLIGTLILSVFDEHSRAEDAKKDYNFGTFIKDYTLLVANEIKKLQDSKHDILMDVANSEKKGGPLYYLDKEQLVARYDESRLHYKATTPESAYRDLVSCYISTHPLAHEASHAQVYVDEHLKVTHAYIISPNGDKIAQHLKSTFPDGVDVSRMSIERRVILTPRGALTPSGIVIYDKDGYIHRLGNYGGSSDLMKRLTQEGKPFLNKVKDLQGRESYP